MTYIVKLATITKKYTVKANTTADSTVTPSSENTESKIVSKDFDGVNGYKKVYNKKLNKTNYMPIEGILSFNNKKFSLNKPVEVKINDNLYKGFIPKDAKIDDNNYKVRYKTNEGKELEQIFNISDIVDNTFVPKLDVYYNAVKDETFMFSPYRLTTNKGEDKDLIPEEISSLYNRFFKEDRNYYLSSVPAEVRELFEKYYKPTGSYYRDRSMSKYPNEFVLKTKEYGKKVFFTVPKEYLERISVFYRIMSETDEREVNFLKKFLYK
jgi:hypothetical protein